ncbi:MAG: VCBS repeat-containing protein, partial [Rhodothermales bacterium]
DGHGSFQIHNHGASETLIAYNSFGNGGDSELGIGNSPTGNPDWTFRAVAPTYTIKNLQVLILPAKSRIAGNGAFGKVAEASDFTVIYELPMPDNVDLSASVPVPYTVDNTGPLAGQIFTRIAYYLELDSGAGTEWVYVSMDPFTADLSRIGLPHPTTNALVTQQIVNNMNVVASGGAGVTTGTGISTGNVEFWPSNYSGSNAIGIPGASGAFDFGDGGAGTGDGYGSFQIHNHGASETLIAYSAFGSANTDNIGIGNQPTGSPDWTFANSAPTYSIKNLQILARVTDSGLASGGAYAHVPEVSDYTLVYEMAIPNALDLGSSVPVPYTIDNSIELGAITFSRIAYYLELDNGGGTEWVYVSMDAFADSLAEIGVPHPTSNATIHQQIIGNMNVFASAGAGVTTGTGIGTGNIEMWPNSYGTANAIGIPGANSGNYDFGDQATGADGYGSFQIHNHGAGETIMVYSGFGSNDADNLGIGNRSTSHPDWTFANNAASYTIKNLQVFVLSNGLLSNDSDPDGDPLIVNGAATSGQPGAGALSATSAQGASVTVLADGSYNYDPTLAPALNALATGQTLIDTFTYLADDGNGGTAFATANITVTGVDDLTDDLLTVTKRDSATIIDVLANDSPAPAAIISVTPNTNGGPGGSVINNGTDISYDPNGQFNSLLTGETAIDIFTYTVTGGGVAKVTVTIQGVTGTVFRFR